MKELEPLKELFRQGERSAHAIEFGFWLVNAPAKQFHKKEWIINKYNQWKKECEQKK